MSIADQPATQESLDQLRRRMLEKYIRIGADEVDTASMLEISVTELNERFGDVVEHARAERHLMLLKLIWQAANEGNITILTWLAKVELGWAERAKRGKVAPAKRPDTNFDFESFASEFTAVHAVRKPKAAAKLQRAVLSAVRLELTAGSKPKSGTNSCTVSVSSPPDCFDNPSSVTHTSRSHQRQNKPSS